MGEDRKGKERKGKERRRRKQVEPNRKEEVIDWLVSGSCLGDGSTRVDRLLIMCE